MNEQLIALAKVAAATAGLDSVLVCAVIEQESSWDTWAYRYEPAFFKNYVVGLYTAGKIDLTEAEMRATSWGLMQLMGQCAREDGYTGKFLSTLCDPATGIEWGCKHLVRKMAAARNDPARALQLWNGGGNPNYAAEVLARMPKYH